MTDDKNKTKKLKRSEIKKYQALLLEKRNELLGNVSYMEKDALREEHSDLSHVPIHMADLGSDSYEQEFTLGLMDSERKIIIEIDKALQRIENGEYGICEVGGEPIPPARLEAIPWARCCVKCASDSEKKSSKRTETYDKYNDINDIEEDVKKVS